MSIFLKHNVARHSALALLFLSSSAIPFGAGCSSDDGTSSSESEVNVAPSPFWKNNLSFPNEPFAASGAISQPRWVKFTILTSDPTKVYFQDSNKYAFHYEFAKNHLPGFARMTPAEFGRATLKADGQKLVSGAVLMPPRAETMEFGIQLIREDEYSKEDVKRLHDLVKANVVVDAGRAARAFYMPTFELSRAAQRDAEWLRTHDITIGAPDRWLVGDACYAPGWAFGKAKFFPGAEIKQAYLDGRLTMEDILVTDGVPAEVPYVAGIVSLAPSTPSSHVAILSQTWGIPFVFPAAQATRDLVRGLATDGKEIAVRTIGGSDAFGGALCSLDLIKPEGTIDAQTRADLAELRRPTPAEVPAKTRLGALTKSTALLTPADVKYFGGKASNFGTLRRTIPNNSPNALGISFDLWDAFLAQALPSGRTLKQEIDERLGTMTFPPNMGVLETKLEEIRKLFIDEAKLPAAEKTKLFAELKAFGFDSKIKIRFRSSTNVEDGAVLSGAGLYDSFSGCLADDLDADNQGPSACDPDEAKEKGVERAIKKVFASFFNTNAVLERLKYRIPESKVGMAMAVHYSSPDEREAANGVATVRLSDFQTLVELVSQPGAESVTNPTGGGLPETVSVTIYGGAPDEIATYFRQGSSLVQLGAKVMKWEDDYKALARLIDNASKAFKTDHGFTGDELSIDLEYKKDTDGKLLVKQIRQIPERSRTPSVVPVLLNESLRLCTAQAEYGDVLANHRMKAQGALTLRSTKLSEQAIATPLVSNLDFELMDGARVRKAGSPKSFRGALHKVEGESVRDAWKSRGGTLTLDAAMRLLVAPSEVPLVVARDFRWTLMAKYTTPRPTLSWEGIAQTTEESVMLERCATDDAVAADIQTIDVPGPRGLKVKTRFRYLKPNGPFEKTSSLARWESSEIRGLTSQPIVLKGWYAQTFRPQHHNFSEDFMFEPGLEEGLPSAIARELAAKDIQALVMLNAVRNITEGGGAKFYVLKKSTQELVPFAE